MPEGGLTKYVYSVYLDREGILRKEPPGFEEEDGALSGAICQGGGRECEDLAGLGDREIRPRVRLSDPGGAGVEGEETQEAMT